MIVTTTEKQFMPEKEYTDKEIAAHLHTIFPSREIASRMVALTVTKRPIGVDKKSYYPYYTAYHATMIKKSIDSMIITRESIIYRYAEFCEGPNATMSENTLYNMVRQAIRYLIDYMDTPELTYRTWQQVIKTSQSRSRGGVCIDFRPDFRSDGVKGIGELVVPPTDGLPKWKNEMNIWLEDTENVKPFIRERLTLSSSEVLELKMDLKEIRGIMCNVDATRIQIMKV